MAHRKDESGQGITCFSGNLDVFINPPLKLLQTSPQAARVILGAFLNAGLRGARQESATSGSTSFSVIAAGSGHCSV
ncbi:MAG: hypothetical protein ACLQU2_19110 [Candidatus Binataceae bacterium]